MGQIKFCAFHSNAIMEILLSEQFHNSSKLFTLVLGIFPL